MDASSYDSLTRSELAVLRLLSREKEVGEIATELGLTISTVETYIKSARRKLGGAGRYVAARSVREFEASRNRGSPTPGLSSGVAERTPVAAGEVMSPDQLGDRVQEERVAFRFGDEVPSRNGAPESYRPGGMNLVILRLLMVVGVALVLAALLLLAIPLGESAQRLANLVDPHRVQ